MNKLIILISVMLLGGMTVSHALLFETTIDLVSRTEIISTLTITNNSSIPFDCTFPDTGWHSVYYDGLLYGTIFFPVLIGFHLDPWQSYSEGFCMDSYSGFQVGPHTIQSAMKMYDGIGWDFYPVGNICYITVYPTYHNMALDFQLESANPDSISFVFTMTNQDAYPFHMGYNNNWLKMKLNGVFVNITPIAEPIVINLVPDESYFRRIVYNPTQTIPYAMHQVWFYIADLPYNPDYEYPQMFNVLVEPTGINEELEPILQTSVYPNPFNSELTIYLENKCNALVKTSIYNTKGQLVKDFGVNRNDIITWDGRDKNNQTVSNGFYFIRAEQDGNVAMHKVLKIK